MLQRTSGPPQRFKAISDPKKFACYAGVVPFERSSGQRKGRPQVSHRANKKVKSLLHMGAMSAVQHCTQLKAYYERKVGEGKIGSPKRQNAGAQ